MRWFGDVLNRGPMRDGVLGIGGNGGPDKQKESSAQSSLTNVFNYGLPTAQKQQDTGNKNLQNSSDYWQRLLTGGRTDTAALAAPAVNSTLAGADATKQAASQFGSGRSGGDVAQKREASTQTQSKIDDTINQNLVAGRAAGAQGIQSVGSTQVQEALATLGLSNDAIAKVLASAQADRSGVRDSQTAIWGDVIKGIL